MVKTWLFIGFGFICLLLAACSASSAAANATPLSEEEAFGEDLFTAHCASCHSTMGDTVIVGPPLSGVATRAETRVVGLDAAAYIEQSILEPSAYVNDGYQDLMPKTFGVVLSGDEVDALVAYLLTLK
jgi:cytochrome c